AQHQGPAADRAGPGAAGLGVLHGGGLRPHAGGPGQAPRRGGLGVLRAGADRHDRLLGPALAPHPRPHPLPPLPARPHPCARPRRDQILGQALGLPPTMGLFSFIGVAVTSATVVIYKESIWDPVVLITKFRNPLVLAVALVSLCIATLATNIAANVVSPAND